MAWIKTDLIETYVSWPSLLNGECGKEEKNILKSFGTGLGFTKFKNTLTYIIVEVESFYFTAFFEVFPLGIHLGKS